MNITKTRGDVQLTTRAISNAFQEAYKESCPENNRTSNSSLVEFEPKQDEVRDQEKYEQGKITGNWTEYKEYLSECNTEIK